MKSIMIVRYPRRITPNTNLYLPKQVVKNEMFSKRKGFLDKNKSGFQNKILWDFYQ